MSKNKKPQSWNTLFQQKLTQILNNIKQLKNVLKKWNEYQDAGQNIIMNNQSIIIKYLQYLKQNCQVDRYKTFILQKQYNKRNFEQAHSQKQIYINCKLFGDSHWTLLVNQETISQIQLMSEEPLMQMMSRLSLYLQGYMPICQNKQMSTLFQLKKSLFKGRIYKQCQPEECYSLLLQFGVEKIPSFDFNNIEKLTSFSYKNYIQIISVLQPETQKKTIDKIVCNFQQLQKQNPTKNFQLNDQLFDDKLKMNPKTIYFNFIKKQDINDQIYCLSPHVYQNQFLSEDKNQDFFFTLQDYFDQKKFIISKQNQISTKQQQEFLNDRLFKKQFMKQFRIQYPKSLVNLVDGFQRYKLTLDQKQIIWAAHNTITLGRSGTGKTVSAIVKLLSIQIYHRKKQKKASNKQNQTSENLSAQDIEKPIGLKNIFLTASEKLIYQIKNIYEDLKNDIQAQIRIGNNKNQVENSTILEKQTKSIFQIVTNMNKKDQNFDMFEDYSKKQINKRKINSFQKLNEKDYPGFFSISEFIILIDGTVSNPFFKVQKEAEQKQQQQQILQQKIGCAYFDQQIYQIQEQVHERNKRQKKVQLIQTKTKMTYNIFHTLFWQTLDLSNYKTNKELSPAVIWSEIYSIIKGSVISHRSHSKFLSKVQYLRLSQDKFYNRDDKKTIYSIFEYYQQWKKQTGYFDQMDVVNRILSEIRRQGYTGPLMNYLFIDEVQDLTPATLYLLSNIFENGLFYFGDTAQSIAKGVSFKFGDIQKMFSKKFQLQNIQLPCPQRIQLTVNFRSHNQILQLANSMISSIQYLFQGSIDVMKKQKSNFHGPKPILINKINQLMLLQLLTDQIKDKSKIDDDQLKQFSKKVQDQKYYMLSAQQAIIVRNSNQQKKLPYRLQKATVLTYDQAKGLQYDDIILYNYFSASKDNDMWKLLSYLDVITVQRNREEYQRQIKLRQNQIAQNQRKLQVDLQEQIDQNNETQTLLDQGKKFYKVKTIVVNEKKIIKQQDRNKYYDLLSELKILYTIITRAKKTFVIYDTKMPPQLQNLWTKMGLIKSINTQEDLINQKNRIARYKAKYKSRNYLQQQKSYKKQGIKWFFKKNYDKAIKAFKNINQTKAIDRVLAEKLKHQCQIQMKKIDTQLRNPKKLQKQLFKIKKKTLQNRKQLLQSNFIKAGQLFQRINCLKSAGNCYYEGQNFKKALHCFQKCQFDLGCAQACEKLKQFERAGIYFEKLAKIQRMFQCYQKAKNWKKTFQKYDQYKQNFQIKQLTSNFYIKYGNKYLHQIISKFVQSINGFNIIWKSQHVFKYIPPFEKIYTKDYIKRKISQQCAKYLEKLKNAFATLQIYQKQFKSLNNQSQKIQQQLNQIYLKVQIVQPCENIQKVKIYDNIYSQYQRTFKGKQLEEFIKKQSTLEKPITMQVVQKVKNQLKNYKNEMQNKQKQFQLINQKINQKSQMIQNIEIKYGTQKNIKDKFNYFYNLLKQNYRQNSQNNLLITLQSLQFKQEEQINENIHIKQFRRLNPQYRQNHQNSCNLYQRNQIQGQNFENFDESFQTMSNYSQQIVQQSQSNVVFNFSIEKNILKLIIEEAKYVIQKSSFMIHKQMKGPFSLGHHLCLNAKVQSHIKVLLKNSDIQQAFSLIKKIQFIGQQQYCLLISSYYKCYQNCKKYIISYCANFSSIFKKCSQVFQARSKISQECNNKQYSQIYLFLNRINPLFLQRQTFRTINSKQSIINSVTQSLILLGDYKEVYRYINKSHKVELSCYFMSYQKLIQSLFNKTDQHTKKKLENNANKPYYYFVHQTIEFSDMINFFTFNQIFWLYDSFQDQSFLSQNDWISTVVLDDKQSSNLANLVQKFIGQKEAQIKNINQKIQKYQQNFYIQVPCRHKLQRQKTVQTLKNIKQQIQNLKIDKKQLDNLMNHLHNQKANLQKKVNQNNRKIRTNQLKVDFQISEIRETSQIIKQLSLLCQVHTLQTQIIINQENSLRLYLNTKQLKNLKDVKNTKKVQQNYQDLVNDFIDIIDSYEEEQQQQKRQAINHKLLQYFKECRKIVKLIHNSLFKSSYKAHFIQKVKQSFSFILQNNQLKQSNKSYKNQVKQKQYSIQMYRQQVANIFNSIERQKLKLKRQQNLWKWHQDQLKQIQRQMIYLQKAKKQNQNNLQKQQNQYRSIIFQKRRSEIAQQNKLNYRIKTIRKITNYSDGSSKKDDMVFIKQLINGFQQKFQQANTYSFKLMLLKIIENGQKSVDKLDSFGISEVIVFYLCCLNYKKFSQNIKDFLLKQQQIAISKLFEQSMQIVHDNIRLIKKQLLKIQQQTKQIFSGYMSRQVKEKYKGLIDRLQKQQQIKKYGSRQVKINPKKKCHQQFIKMMNLIYERILRPQSEQDIKFIYILLGFFQCKVVQNSNLLWFLDCQYVLIKSTSILIKEAIKNPNMFCYYMDKTKQVILMNFFDVYKILRNFIQNQHKSFMKLAGYKFQYIKQSYMGKQLLLKIKYRKLDNKMNQEALQSEIFCNRQKQIQIKQLYRNYTQEKIPKQIQKHKLQLFKFYFSNEFKTHENFHFFFHQLKSICQIQDILGSTPIFNYSIMKQMKNLYQNLEQQYKVWQKYFQKYEKENNQK